MARSAARDLLPPIHFVSGRGVSLPELAALAVSAGDGATSITIDAPRAYDVTRFIGDPRRAETLLGWKAETTIEDGVARFVGAFRERRHGAAAKVAAE